MRTEEEIKDRLKQLEEEYDAHDPPASSIEEEKEVAILRAIEELEWVLSERDESQFTT